MKGQDMKRELVHLMGNLGKGITKHADAQKIWQFVAKNKHLSKANLDRLALLAGYQRWEDLRHAVRTGGEENFKFEAPKKQS